MSATDTLVRRLKLVLILGLALNLNLVQGRSKVKSKGGGQTVSAPPNCYLLKSTAVVLPPQTNTPTRSPGCGW